MIFRFKKLHNKPIAFIYGFKTNDRVYDMVLTLEIGLRTTKIHALLSKVTMSPKDFFNMWEFMKENVKTRFFEFEVIDPHQRFYEKVFKSVAIKESKTFDGIQSFICRVHRCCEFMMRIPK